jgi:hypothetical protein
MLACDASSTARWVLQLDPQAEAASRETRERMKHKLCWMCEMLVKQKCQTNKKCTTMIDK